eukprot:2058065-Amphidinium_carterae.1
MLLTYMQYIQTLLWQNFAGCLRVQHLAPHEAPGAKATLLGAAAHFEGLARIAPSQHSSKRSKAQKRCEDKYRLPWDSCQLDR